MDAWIQTYSGVEFSLNPPRPENVNLIDVAHSLSLICRYTGHSARHYSVAQHSVLVSELVRDANALWGLLHDAHEAYVGDVASPMKLLLPDYQKLESSVANAVREAFGLQGGVPAEVKLADLRMLVTEASHLLGPAPRGWGIAAKQFDIEIKPWTPEEAERKFIKRFTELAPISLLRKIS